MTETEKFVAQIVRGVVRHAQRDQLPVSLRTIRGDDDVTDDQLLKPAASRALVAFVQWVRDNGTAPTDIWGEIQAQAAFGRSFIPPDLRADWAALLDEATARANARYGKRLDK
ncbi:MAG TPA: hypothetical protein VGC41_25600 [Kofleriaceae bacterium]